MRRLEGGGGGGPQWGGGGGRRKLANELNRKGRKRPCSSLFTRRSNKIVLSCQREGKERERGRRGRGGGRGEGEGEGEERERGRRGRGEGEGEGEERERGRRGRGGGEGEGKARGRGGGTEGVLSSYVMSTYSSYSSSLRTTESSEWSLQKVYTLRTSSPETHSIKHRKSSVTYVIHIQRKMFYYFVYLIIPCMLTSLMTLIIFTLPPESGERMVVGMTTLLALTVFYMLAASRIPETSEVVPLIGRSVRENYKHPSKTSFTTYGHRIFLVFWAPVPTLLREAI